VNGINYGAFAAAPAIVNPMVTALVNPHNLSPSATPYLDKTEKYFTNAEVLDNFPKVYYFAVIGQFAKIKFFKCQQSSNCLRR
jgi:hypothetical protein